MTVNAEFVSICKCCDVGWLAAIVVAAIGCDLLGFDGDSDGNGAGVDDNAYTNDELYDNIGLPEMIVVDVVVVVGGAAAGAVEAIEKSTERLIADIVGAMTDCGWCIVDAW